MKLILTDQEKKTTSQIFWFAVRFALVFSAGMLYGLILGRGIWRD